MILISWVKRLRFVETSIDFFRWLKRNLIGEGARETLSILNSFKKAPAGCFQKETR